MNFRITRSSNQNFIDNRQKSSVKNYQFFAGSCELNMFLCTYIKFNNFIICLFSRWVLWSRIECLYDVWRMSINVNIIYILVRVSDKKLRYDVVKYYVDVYEILDKTFFNVLSYCTFVGSSFQTTVIGKNIIMLYVLLFVYILSLQAKIKSTIETMKMCNWNGKINMISRNQ